jgi:hypothetical protein
LTTLENGKTGPGASTSKTTAMSLKIKISEGKVLCLESIEPLGEFIEYEALFLFVQTKDALKSIMKERILKETVYA